MLKCLFFIQNRKSIIKHLMLTLFVTFVFLPKEVRLVALVASKYRTPGITLTRQRIGHIRETYND